MAIMTSARRWLWTLFVVLSVGFAASGIADQAGERYGGDAFQRALVTFAVARALNGVISVAQGTEVAVEPGGVGVNFGVGQILDPVNDLVERFSGIMLIAASSLGLQNFLLTFTSWWGATLAFGIAGVALLAALWWPRQSHAAALHWAMRIFLLFAFARFVVPVLVVGSNVVFDAFLAKEQAAAVAALQATNDEIEALNTDNESAEVAADQSLLDRIGAAFDETLASVNVSDRIQRFRDALSNASEHIINLIVIFLLQTVILPLLFVWLLAEAMKTVAGRATRLH